MTLLIQQAEREAKADSMGIKISDSDVQKRLDQIVKQYFHGKQSEYQAQLKKQKLSDKQVREDIRSQLISEAVFNKVTKSANVSDSDVHAYYVAHPQLYTQPQSRDLRYILVGKNKALAQSVYQQLKNGNDQTWCKLAKKYAKDASGQNCGKATFTKGQTVPVFDKIAFSTPTKVVHAPFYDPTQYKAWFVIEALSPVKPRQSTPEKQVASTIKQTLAQQKKNQAMTDWVASTSKDFCSGGKIKYQVGSRSAGSRSSARTRGGKACSTTCPRDCRRCSMHARCRTARARSASNTRTSPVRSPTSTTSCASSAPSCPLRIQPRRPSRSGASRPSSATCCSRRSTSRGA